MNVGLQGREVMVHYYDGWIDKKIVNLKLGFFLLNHAQVIKDLYLI